MTSIKLYNSLTRQLEEVQPLQKGKIGLYTCGPTVYDHAHIGNLRTYIFEDTLRRTLQLAGYKVKHVMNITDIEDKIFARAREQGKDYSELTRHYEKVFMDDTKLLGIELGGSTIIRATEAIADMQAIIAKIPNKYTADDGVYFDITKYPDYGVFEKLDRSHEHHRINNDEYDKDHVADFALWKVHKEGEASWDFELEGKKIAGRPGWHIECSAMSTKYLGQPFDIHTGGVDLKFPHHENEIAQAKAATGKDLAKIFVHGEHLLVDGKKMSKSLKNFYTLEDVVAKDFDPLAFRLLVLQAHYRSQLNFSWDSLEAAQNRLNDLRAWADLRHQPSTDKMPVELDDMWRTTLEDIRNQMLNDLNSPGALASLSQLINWMESRPVPAQDGSRSEGALAIIDDLFGLNLDGRPDITDEQKELIKAREVARDTKQWARSDELRDQLKTQGVGLKDTDRGTIWSRL